MSEAGFGPFTPSTWDTVSTTTTSVSNEPRCQRSKIQRLPPPCSDPPEMGKDQNGLQLMLLIDQYRLTLDELRWMDVITAHKNDWHKVSGVLPCE